MDASCVVIYARSGEFDGGIWVRAGYLAFAKIPNASALLKPMSHITLHSLLALVIRVALKKNQ